MAKPDSSDSSSPLTPSETLLQQVRADRQDAWVRLVEFITPLVYSWSRLSGLQPDDAADITQEVLLGVRRRILGFRRDQQSQSFRGWLWTITRNCLCRFATNKARRPVVIGGSDIQRTLAEVPAHEPAMPDSADETGVIRIIDLLDDWAGTHFEPTTWRAFKHVVMDGLSAAEVGRALGISSGAVRQAKYHVRRKLRDEFGDLWNLI